MSSIANSTALERFMRSLRLELNTVEWMFLWEHVLEAVQLSAT